MKLTSEFNSLRFAAAVDILQMLGSKDLTWAGLLFLFDVADENNQLYEIANAALQRMSQTLNNLISYLFKEVETGFHFVFSVLSYNEFKNQFTRLADHIGDIYQHNRQHSLGSSHLNDALTTHYFRLARLLVQDFPDFMRATARAFLAVFGENRRPEVLKVYQVLLDAAKEPFVMGKR
jgi:hypothetical protein